MPKARVDGENKFWQLDMPKKKKKKMVWSNQVDKLQNEQITYPQARQFLHLILPTTTSFRPEQVCTLKTSMLSRSQQRR
jgi:hypothetical protein